MSTVIRHGVEVTVINEGVTQAVVSMGGSQGIPGPSGNVAVNGLIARVADLEAETDGLVNGASPLDFYNLASN